MLLFVTAEDNTYLNGSQLGQIQKKATLLEEYEKRTVIL
jgi:hypothetical protein